MNDVESPILYVGVGASAGGLEAMEAFFATVPPDTGLAFVVIQHLSPEHKSLMVELLSRRTRMRVVRAEDGAQVERDTIYLITPRKNLTLLGGRLFQQDPDPGAPLNLPIDLFFRSLAEDQGAKAVAVVLSGTGSDGMRGARAVKERGGTVMVQEPESAKFDGMPRSAISTGLTDFVLPPEELSAKLLSFAQHPYVRGPGRAETAVVGQTELGRIFAYLRERTQLDFTHYKPTTVARRIERRMSINGIRDLGDYVRYLEAYPAEVKNLYGELLIGVTQFFRDPQAFQILGERCLPELIAQARDQEVRIWVAGCSTGEEAYSLAILMRQVMERTGHRGTFKIFATDADSDAIARAGNGIYPESISADLPPGVLQRFFVRHHESLRIAPEIRERVVFARHNLVKDPPFTNIDLISCRNLLIYLQPILQAKVMEYIGFSLNPGGLLLLGSSETAGDQGEGFEVLDQKWRIYRTRGKRHPVGLPIDMAVPIPPFPGGAGALGPRLYARRLRDDQILERFLQGIAKEFLPATIIVNEASEILHTFGDAARYLRVPTGPMQTDLSRMVHRELSIPLATGIQKVLQRREPVRYTNVNVTMEDGSQRLQVEIMPLPIRKGQEPIAAVLISGMQSPTPPGAGVDESYDLDKEAKQRITDLEQELQFSRENLQATIEELETTNEELQAANEELLSSNEELQSTNEELQSVNEELHTVNSEHQLRILELAEANNDLRNLVEGTEIAAVFLDENLDLRRFTPGAVAHFELGERDVGRPFAAISSRLAAPALQEWIRAVASTEQPRDELVKGQGGRQHLLRVRPYRIAPNVSSGVALTLIDLTELHQTRAELEVAEAALSSARRAYGELLQRLDEGVAVLHVDGEGRLIVDDASAGAAAVTGRRREEVVGRPVEALASGLEAAAVGALGPRGRVTGRIPGANGIELTYTAHGLEGGRILLVLSGPEPVPEVAS